MLMENETPALKNQYYMSLENQFFVMNNILSHVTRSPSSERFTHGGFDDRC